MACLGPDELRQRGPNNRADNMQETFSKAFFFFCSWKCLYLHWNFNGFVLKCSIADESAFWFRPGHCIHAAFVVQVMAWFRLVANFYQKQFQHRLMMPNDVTGHNELINRFFTCFLSHFWNKSYIMLPTINNEYYLFRLMPCQINWQKCMTTSIFF